MQAAHYVGGQDKLKAQDKVLHAARSYRLGEGAADKAGGPTRLVGARRAAVYGGYLVDEGTPHGLKPEGLRVGSAAQHWSTRLAEVR